MHDRERNREDSNTQLPRGSSIELHSDATSGESHIYQTDDRCLSYLSAVNHSTRVPLYSHETNCDRKLNLAVQLYFIVFTGPCIQARSLERVLNPNS